MKGKGLFLLSQSYKLENEAAMISEILGSLPFLTFHVRKPDSSAEEVSELLEQLPVIFHKNIVVHYFPELLESFQLKGWHFSPFRPVESNIKPVSASAHSPEELSEFAQYYSYVFCSPLFDSISKPGYKGIPWDIRHEPESVKSKAVALGGISELTIPVARTRGFHNFAVLGSAWNAPDPVFSMQQLSKLIWTNEN